MLAKLPIFQSSVPELSLMQTQWATSLNPLIASPVLNGVLLKEVALVSGTNFINHKLNRKLQGWIVTRKRADESIYDLQDDNKNPALTLALASSGTVTIDLYVF